MTDDTPNEVEVPESDEVVDVEDAPEDPTDGVIPGADDDGYVNDDSDLPENDPAIEGDVLP